MPTISYCTHGGETYDVQVEAGTSVMEGAVRNGVPGIDGDCGGACACATCHVYVDEPWLSRLDPQGEMERSMLEFAEHVRENSRLGCQIKMRPDLDGLRVNMPESQH